MINRNELEQFTARKEELDKRVCELDKTYGRISTLRIISFLLGAALLIVGISDGVPAASAAGVLFLTSFVCFIKKHGDVVRETETEKSRLKVVERYLARFDDGWRDFAEDGSEYMSDTDTVASDVDLLGSDSLFQMLNVCHTDMGKEKLAGLFKAYDFDREETIKRREASEELLSKTDFAVNFEAAGERLEGRKKKLDLNKFEAACTDKNIGLPAWCRVISILFPAAELVMLVLWLTGVIGYGYPLVGFLLLLSFSWLTAHITNDVILPLYGVRYVVDDYIDMMTELSREEFSSKKLAELKDLVCGDNGAPAAFRALRGISQAYNICYNPLLHQLLSGIVLWDYQLASMVLRWRTRYGEGAVASFMALAETEVLLSLSALGRVRDIGWGDITDEPKSECTLVCDEIYHPLISPERVVANSVSLKNGITVITGSNMSGKTTFLRTVAVNLILAYIGAPICGKGLKAGYMRVFTSMRITDDVAHGISTFYAEILRIKNMAEYRKRNLPMLCLIDEIFKGTNSADRVVGAREVLKGLSGSNCMTLVSTHDFELCTITDCEQRAAVNYHFEEYYDDDVLKFDYRIKDGRCTTTNARAILRMAGFEVAD